MYSQRQTAADCWCRD